MALISREVLLKKLNEEEKRICRESFAECPYKDPYDVQALNEIRVLRHIVSNSDSCEAEPKDKGKWLRHGLDLICSICNQPIAEWQRAYKYCPHCGVKME